MIKPYHANYHDSLNTALVIANGKSESVNFSLTWGIANYISTMMIHRETYCRTDTYRIRQKLHNHYDQCYLGDCPECESLMILLSKLNNCIVCGSSRNEIVTLLMISGRLGLYLPDEMYRYISQFLHMGLAHMCVCHKCRGTAILFGKCIRCYPLQPEKYLTWLLYNFFYRNQRSQNVNVHVQENDLDDL